MKTWSRRFNIYLLAGIMASFVGCQILKSNEGEKGDKDKKRPFLWLLLEENPDGTQRSRPAPIYRANPEYVTVSRSPFLSDDEMEDIKVVDDSDTFEIKIKFTADKGMRWLESTTAANRGRRIVVLGRFGGEKRWLAAPIISQRISNGILSFTPDATREEASQLVDELRKKHKMSNKKKPAKDTDWPQ